MILKKIFLLGLLALLFLACSDDDVEETVEEYLGTYFVIDDSVYITNVGMTTDSVILTIYNNRSYYLMTYKYNQSDPKLFCNSEGNVDGFGSNVVIFTPTGITGSNCDQIRIPDGRFIGDFVSHGDTIILNRTGEVDSLPNSIFRFTLLKL